MTENIRFKLPPYPPLDKGGRRGGVAFLWDESFLWGLMAHKALKGLRLPFDLVTAEEIQAGGLAGYRMLFVPGGWASNKGKKLGEAGIRAIQDFVSGGGSYLGFCGGAGLATGAKGGMGLLNVMRRPTSERVPSFSGRIELNISEHPIWKGLAVPIFHAWWPSQFIVGDNGVNVLATYGAALPDAFSSDLNVGDTEACGGWKKFEDIYRINLDPRRLVKEPSIIEGTYGKGKVILSLIHFDTPGDLNGEQALVNLWEYLAGERAEAEAQNYNKKSFSHDPVGAIHELPLQNLCSDLIALGERNFLWFWRTPMLLQWRRGVRGFEYNTLYIMMKEILELMASREAGAASYVPALGKIKELLVPFIEKAERLLVLERHAMQDGHITYERCDDDEIRAIRLVLFSDSKSYGGMFKALIDEVDTLLFSLISLGKET